MDDLEGHFPLSFKTYASFGVHHKNLNEDRLQGRGERYDVPYELSYWAASPKKMKKIDLKYAAKNERE